jgi:potassium efflux system protein
MTRARIIFRKPAAGLMGLALGLAAVPLAAQATTQTEAPAATGSAPTTDSQLPAGTESGADGATGLAAKIADVEASLAAIESDQGMDDAAKELLRKKYQQAMDLLRESANLAAQAGRYRDAPESAPGATAKLQEQRQALPSPDEASRALLAAMDTESGDADELRKAIDARVAGLNSLRDELTGVTRELARLQSRPVEISKRLPQAERDLAELTSQLASTDVAGEGVSPGRAADRVVDQARQARLASELEMLRQEQLSLAVREDLLQARQQLLQRQVENASAALEVLRARHIRELANDADRVGTLAELVGQDLPADDQAARLLATEVQVLAQEYQQLVASLNEVSAAKDDISRRSDALTREFEGIQEQLKLGSAGGAMAQVLFALDRRLLKASTDVEQLRFRIPTLHKTRDQAFQVAVKLRDQPNVAGRFADRDADVVAQLVEARGDVLQRLDTQYGNLIRAIAMFEGEQRRYLLRVRDFEDFLSEQLFWMQSSPPVSFGTLAAVPGGLRWSLQGTRWRELMASGRAAASRHPWVCLGLLAVTGLLLSLRGRIAAALDRTGTRIRRISTDRYRYTLEALLWTVLLAAPLPLLLGFAAWMLGQTVAPSGWLRGLRIGVTSSAWMAVAISLLAAVCRDRGLGDAHFRWSPGLRRRYRRAMHQFALAYIPALILTCTTLLSDVFHYFDSLGRLSFIVAHVALTFVLWQLFRGPDGILAALRDDPETSRVYRWRSAWSPLAVAWPLALAGLAAAGYMITAMELSFGMLGTMATIAGAVILYALTLRWFAIRRRRLALAEAIDERRARQEEAALPEGPTRLAGETGALEAEDEEEIDLASIHQQTRHVLRWTFSLAAAIAVILFWSGTIPLISVLESVTVPLTGGRSVLTFVNATFIVVAAYVAVQNLPGLLELAVLRDTKIEPGTRAAIGTLCQYAVVALALALFLQVLKIDWVRFGWIAAALSVGVGFGLQEIVANFVCGLLLLFERPIRVGDIVTVDGTTGTVTRIQIRATTITNWDRQEFVVPNRNLITGTIVNWTLTASLNRVVIPVGVAYGSDTDRARQILLAVAADHPVVLPDPAPMATFEEFADSSLTLRLYAYLPNLTDRLQTITELHTEIGKRLAAAGIEIAFPQRDLNLRGGWERLVGPPADRPQRGPRDASPAG